MASDLELFEQIARRAYRSTESSAASSRAEHAFEERGMHPDLPPEARSLFDNGHYVQATLEALKFLDGEVKRISDTPILRLNAGVSTSEKDEQGGFKFLFAGAMMAIRNPRAHTSGIVDDPDACLDHLSLASMLLRRLDEAGLR
jgi:Protein of unknown function (Hypoth_ymh)